MSIETLSRVLYDSAAILESNEDALSAIDSETGDGDHGVTVAKIARAIMAETEDSAASTAGELLGDVSMAIMGLNGGSAGPLWAMMFDGAGEAAGDAEEVDGPLVGAILGGALEGLGTVSDAQPGMKTMVDALAPAAAAAAAECGSVEESLLAAAEAAEEGAEATRDMLAHYGRAKNLKEDSLGHLDPGAVGVATMLRAIYDVYRENK